MQPCLLLDLWMDSVTQFAQICQSMWSGQIPSSWTHIETDISRPIDWRIDCYNWKHTIDNMAKGNYLISLTRLQKQEKIQNVKSLLCSLFFLILSWSVQMKEKASLQFVLSIASTAGVAAPHPFPFSLAVVQNTRHISATHLYLPRDMASFLRESIK